jgi:2,3-bisphosphoglycerate-dependent phosphoglycerate mutase
MGISFLVGNRSFEIGTASFLNSFFSTIYVKLENEKWGSRFPTIMRELHSGKMSYKSAETATQELLRIRTMLREYPPTEVVWDFERRELMPPWENNINPAITSLEECFVTSHGKELIGVMLAVFKEAIRKRKDVVVT